MSAASFAYRDGRIVGAMIQGPDELRAINGDRRWFLAHRGRTLRLRAPAQGELERLAPGSAATKGKYPAMILVRRHPWGRERKLYYTSLPTDAPEEILEGFEQLFESAASQGYEGELTIEDLRRACGGVPRERSN